VPGPGERPGVTVVGDCHAGGLLLLEFVEVIAAPSRPRQVTLTPSRSSRSTRATPRGLTGQHVLRGPDLAPTRRG
jgi:hypothetical protein